MVLLLIISLALQPPWALASDFQFHDHFTDGRTPWTSDQLVTNGFIIAFVLMSVPCIIVCIVFLRL
jgi:hypothetical protein